MNKFLSWIFLFSLASFNAQDFDNPEDIVFDETSQNYFVSNTGNGQIVKVSANGDKSNLGLKGIASHGIVLWNDQIIACNGREVNIINKENGDIEKSISVPQAAFLKDIVQIDPTCFLISDFTKKTIFKLKLNTSGNYEVSVWMELAVIPTGLCADKRYLYFLQWGKEGAVSRVNLATKTIENVFITEFANLLNVTQDDAYLYISALNRNEILKFNKDFNSEAIEIENSNVLHPGGLVFNKFENRLIMTDVGLDRFEIVVSEKNKIEEQVISLNAFPNPVEYNSLITYHLDKGGEVIFQLFNCKGQLVKTVRREFEQEGENQFLLEKDNLSDGLYYLHLSSETVSEAIPITFVR